MSEVLRLLTKPEFRVSLEKVLSSEYDGSSPMADERFVKAKASALIEGTKRVMAEAQKLQFGSRHGAVSVFCDETQDKIILHLQRPGLSLYQDFSLTEAHELQKDLSAQILALMEWEADVEKLHAGEKTT
jgi:hypothetical protein